MRSALLHLLVCVFLSATVGSAAPAPGPLLVRHSARALHPGEVILITVTSADPLKEMTGNGMGRTILFSPDMEKRRWQGLLGIDLETSPRLYTVSIGATNGAGEALTAQYRLRVAPKRFPTRRLTVDEKFVNPPADTISRIQEEARQVEALFGAVSAEKLWSGSFVRPVPGVATSSFGRRSVINGEPRSPHAGTDFRAAEGTPILAPNSGRVVLASDLYFTGNTVILDHGQGLYSYFAHLSRVGVSPGDVVSAGTEIGAVGATGRVTAAHLHWSVRLGGARVDPLSLMEVVRTSD